MSSINSNKKETSSACYHSFSIKDLMKVCKPAYMQRRYVLSHKKITELLTSVYNEPTILKIPLILVVGFPDANGQLDFHHENHKAQQEFNIRNISESSEVSNKTSDTVLSRMRHGNVYVLDGQQRLGALKYYFNEAIVSFFHKKQHDPTFKTLENKLLKLSGGVSFLHPNDSNKTFGLKDIEVILRPWISYDHWLRKANSKHIAYIISHKLSNTNNTDKMTTFIKEAQLSASTSYGFMNKVRKVINNMRKQLMQYRYHYPIPITEENPKGYIEFNLHKQISCVVLNTPRKKWNDVFKNINGEGTPLDGYQILDSNWEQYSLEIPHFKDYQYKHQDIGDLLIDYSINYLHEKDDQGPKFARIQSSGKYPNKKNLRILNLGIFSRALGNLIYDRLFAVNCGQPSTKTFAALGLGALRIMTHNTTSEIKKVNGGNIYEDISKPYDKKHQIREIKPKLIRALLEVVDNLNGYFAHYLSKQGSNMQKITAHKSTYIQKKLVKKELLSFIADLWNDQEKQLDYKRSLPGIMLEYLFNDGHWVGGADSRLNDFITGKLSYRNQSTDIDYWIPRAQQMLQGDYKLMDKRVQSQPSRYNSRSVLASNSLLNTLLTVYAHEYGIYQCNGDSEHGYDIEHILPLAKAKMYEGDHNLIYANHFGNLTLLGSTFNKAKGTKTIYQSYKNHKKIPTYKGVNYKELLDKINYFVKTPDVDYTTSDQAHDNQDLNMANNLKNRNFKRVNEVIQTREQVAIRKLVNYFCKALKENQSKN